MAYSTNPNLPRARVRASLPFLKTGSNEKFNGLLRQFFPKGSSFAAVTQEQVDLRPACSILTSPNDMATKALPRLGGNIQNDHPYPGGGSPDNMTRTSKRYTKRNGLRVKVTLWQCAL